MHAPRVNLVSMVSALVLVLCSALALAGALGIRSAFSADVLYIGDAADNDPQCATQQQTSAAGALGTRQPAGPLGR